MANCDVGFQTASYRGVSFEIMPSDNSGGRRLVTTSYPFTDDHYNEDLGDKPETWSVKGMFVGDGFRDSLAIAKRLWRRGGVGVFFEPTENKAHQVQLIDWSFSYDSKILNAVEFSIELIEAAEKPYPGILNSLSAQIDGIVDEYLGIVEAAYSTGMVAVSDFNEVFRGISSSIGYVGGAVGQFIGVTVAPVTSAFNLVSGGGSGFNSVNALVQDAEPSRYAAANVATFTGIFDEAVKTPDPVGFFRQVSEVRTAGTPDSELQGTMVAAVSLPYYLEALGEKPSMAEVSDFRARADAVKSIVSDPALIHAIDRLITSVGSATDFACFRHVPGSYHALVASYQLFGDVSEAANLIGYSGGISGAMLTELRVPC